MRNVWARAVSLEPQLQQAGTVSPHSVGRLQGFQSGVDLYANGGVAAGVYVGQLQGDVSVSGFASGEQNKQVGFNHILNRYVGLYGTVTSAQGAYLDAVLQGVDYRGQTHGRESLGSARTETEGRGWQASVEVGSPWAWGEGDWTVEPQAQLVYRHMRLEDTVLSNAQVQHRTDSDWLLRIGARVHGRWSSDGGGLQPYARINFFAATRGRDVVGFSAEGGSADIASSNSARSAEAAVGLTWQLSPTASIYAELGRMWALSGSARMGSGAQGSLGLKMLW